MAALLEVTTAINENVPSEDLFKIYGFILQAHLAVNKVVVMYKLGSEWMCVLDQGVSKSLVKEIKPTEDFTTFTEAGPLVDSHLSYEKHFDYFIPVSHKEEPLAYVLLGDEKTEKRDWPDQKKFMQAFTNIVIVAAENKRLFKRQLEQERLSKEIEVARQVQISLIPEKLPNSETLELDSVYLPHSAVGGDYFDYIKLSKHEHLFVVADVSGKGVGASLMMSNFQAQLRAYCNEGIGLKKLVKQLNQGVVRITKGESFITMIIAKYNSKTRTLAYINCGHPPAMLIHRGKVYPMDKGTTIIGAFDTLPHITQQSKRINDEAILMLYSDGLTDTFNEKGEDYDFEQISSFGLRNMHLAIKDFNQCLLNEVEDFKGREDYIDDITILTCRFK